MWAARPNSHIHLTHANFCVCPELFKLSAEPTQYYKRTSDVCLQSGVLMC